MKTYAIKSNQTVKAICSNAELAIGAFKVKREELLQSPINIVLDEPGRFDFYFGWEQVHVAWTVEEIGVAETLEEALHQLGL